MTTEAKGSLPMQALSISARRILDFIEVEHSSHGGKENGNLAAPYSQLAAHGVTKRDIAKGLAELQAAGFVRLTKQGLRQAGGGEPSRYALTWLPTGVGTNNAATATDDWKRVQADFLKQGLNTAPKARTWLADQVAGTPQQRGENTRGRSLTAQI